jgi:ATP-dependent DNA helicase RecG
MRWPPPLADDGGLSERLLAALPFPLTAAQRRALGEIRRDLARPHPMNRLLQGDVGSGKTLVAALSVLPALAAGGQAAVMAPTEILAEQLHLKFHEWLNPWASVVAWLAAALKGKAKRRPWRISPPATWTWPWAPMPCSRPAWPSGASP